MKINQVEELVGITKKNIRFYEEQGLLKPARNPENGYREYGLEDVKCLEKIKLFRKLNVPIEEIHLLLEEKISFQECMERQMIYLNHEQHSLELMQQMCSSMMQEVESLQELDTTKYLEEMARLEVEGTRFMDIEKRDVKKKKVGPIISAIVIVTYFLGIIIAIGWAALYDPIPFGVLMIPLAIIGAVIIGVLIALRQRLKEIDGGEEDEARKY